MITTWVFLGIFLFIVLLCLILSTKTYWKLRENFRNWKSKKGCKRFQKKVLKLKEKGAVIPKGIECPKGHEGEKGK